MTALVSAAAVGFVYTNDRGQALAFYRDTLGLAHVNADDHGDTFAFGQGTMRLTPMAGWKASGHPAIGWEVTDIDATVAALAEKGVAMTVYEGMGQDANGIWRAPDERAALAWFADPDGNCLMLSQHA